VPEKDVANFQETFRRIGERFAVEVFHDEEVDVIYSAGMTSVLRQYCSTCSATVDVVLMLGWLAVPARGQEPWPTPVTEQREDPERAVANEPSAVVAGRWEHEGDTFVIRTGCAGKLRSGLPGHGPAFDKEGT
jgi:hypothetical protein